MLNKQAVLRGIAGLIIMCSVLGSMGFVLLLESKSMIFSYAVKQIEEIDRPEPFPVSVDPIAKTIIEDPAADTFFTDALAAAPDSRRNWWNKVAAFFAEDDWYQNLASPVGRIVVIWPGERKEEAAKTTILIYPPFTTSALSCWAANWLPTRISPGNGPFPTACSGSSPAERPPPA